MRNQSIRSAAAMGLCALLLSSVPAFAGRVEDRDGKTIIHVTISSVPDPTDTATFTRAEVAAIREFIRRFPEIFAARYRDRYKASPAKYGRHNWDNVEIRLEQFSGISIEGAETELLAIAGGTSADVLYVNFRRSDNYVRNGFLYPLDKPEDGYLSGMTKEEIDFRIHPKIWQAIRRKGPSGEQNVWAMPYGGALGMVLLYRKDLFDENHIPYPTEQWTWNDMIAAARALTNPERGTYGIVLSRGKHESRYWMNYLWSAGGEAMVYDEGTDEWRCVFDSREAAVALDFYIRLSAEKWIDRNGSIRRGYSTKDDRKVGILWQRGVVGMLASYIDGEVFALINPDVTGMAPVPLGPTGIRRAEINSRMMGLFSQIRDPVIRDAAWEYMRWYECEEAVRIKTRVMVEGGLGRFVNPKYLRMFGYPEVERLSPKGWSRAFEIAMETGKPEPCGKNSNMAYELMTAPIIEAEQMAINDKLAWGPEHQEERLDILQGILRKGCARANEEMLGIVPPRQRTIRRLCAAMTLTLIVLTFLRMFRRVLRTFAPAKTVGAPKATWAFRKYAWAYLLMLPAVLSILIWNYIPLVRGSMMAFVDYRIIGKSVWVGLDNFGDLLFDGRWWLSVWNSLRYSFLVLFLTFLPPIVLAVLLQEVPRGKLLFRTIFYLPAVTTGLVTVVLWKQFYDPSERGAMNAVLSHVPAVAFVGMGLLLLLIAILFARRLWLHGMKPAACGSVAAGLILLSACTGLAGTILFPAAESFFASLIRIPLRLFDTMPEAVRWLSDSRTAMLACVIPMVWAGVGPGCLIYLAALKGIPNDYYEAADIDGAGFIDKILFVIFPILKPLIIINFVGAFIGSWYGAGGNILVMTGGVGNTEVADLHIWYKAFTFLKFGPATAMAWMLGFMLIGFTVCQLRILSRVEFRATGTGENR